MNKVDENLEDTSNLLLDSVCKEEEDEKESESESYDTASETWKWEEDSSSVFTKLRCFPSAWCVYCSKETAVFKECT